MRRFGVFLVTLALFGGTQASWYWPFDAQAVDERKKRVSELMEPASVLIEEASDLAAAGKTDEAVETYRKALSELDRIEMENPVRAKTVEFATLRNKRAYVNAAIDSMLLAQVQENAKAVSVSDTTELERRLDRERWGKRMDKAREALDRHAPEAALADLERAVAGTTNAVQIAVSCAAAAGAYCQKGSFEEACRALARVRKEVVRAGELSDEERALVTNTLQIVRKGVVDGHRQALETGRRACEGSVRLETMDLTTTNAVSMAGDVVESLRSLPGHLRLFAFPAARNLNRVSSNMLLRASILLKRMKSDGGKAKWEMDVSGLEEALRSFGAVSPGVRRVGASVRSVLKAAGGETKAEDKDPPQNKQEAPRSAEESAMTARLPVASASQPVKPRTKREQVMAAIENGDFTTANRLIGEMLVAKPNGAAALNLKAAMEARQGKFKEAEATLDQAILSNPRSHFAYYNMANLMLQVRKDDKSAAKRYYETGRMLGGPVDAGLEEVLK